MYNTRSNGNCKVNDTFDPTPFPRAATLAAELGTILIIYNGPQCGNTSYAGAWPLVYSVAWDQGWGKGVLSAVAGSAAREHFAALFVQLRALGLSSFTQDFLDFQSLLFPACLENPEGNHAWQGGQAAAALEADVAVQCAWGSTTPPLAPPLPACC